MSKEVVPMEIVFIRHGQTDLNKSGRIQGSSVNLSLNKEGREYAEEAAKNFDPSEFDAVYVSPLDRAVETAEIFTKGQKKLIPDDRLLEFDYGEWDGELLTEMKKKHPDAIDPWGKVAKNYVDYASNGETHEELNKRCGDFLDEMYKKYPDGKVLVVAHGTLIRMMAAHYLTHGDISGFDTIANCGLVKFSVRENIARMIYYNRILA